MSRPPKPTALKLANGSHRADRARNEPQPPPGVPQPPDWLDGEAREQWDNLVPLLEQMHVLTTADGNALARYCALWARWRISEQHIAEHGSVVKTSTGYPIQNPHVGMAARLIVELGKLEQQFGLTPAARTRVQATPPPTENVAVRDRKARFFKGG